MVEIFIRNSSSFLWYCNNSIFTYFSYILCKDLSTRRPPEDILIQIRYFLPDVPQFATETIPLVHLFHPRYCSGDNLDVWPELNELYTSLLSTTIFPGSPETFSSIWQIHNCKVIWYDTSSINLLMKLSNMMGFFLAAFQFI